MKNSRTLEHGLQVMEVDDLHLPEDEGQRIEQIKAKAIAICENRKRNATTLSLAKKDAFENLGIIEQEVKVVKDRIGLFVNDQDSVDKIKDNCNKMLENITEFKSSAQIICDRLQEGKIRIVSIGESSQGKSLFTQILTDIPANSPIIKVKNAGDNKDCTGAVNTFYHDPNQSQNLIYVYFLKVQDVIKSIKSYEKQVREALDNQNWSLNKLSSASSASDLISVIQDTNNIAKIASLTIDVKIVEGIKQYFNSGTGYVNLLGSERKNIGEQEICKYNDMQNPEKLYPAVDKIEITRNLGMQDLFESFVISDTKGSSVFAGDDQHIINTINDCDAVFSITITGNSQNCNFYNSKLGQVYGGNEIFAKKHFAIINVFDSYPLTSADGVLKVLDVRNLCHYCYLGRLVNEKEPLDCNPKTFVQEVMIDMLEKISDYIIDFDNERIKSCRKSGENINNYLSIVNQLLEDVNYVKLDEKKLVKEKLIQFGSDARKYVDDLQKELKASQVRNGEDDMNDDYEMYKKNVAGDNDENRYATVFEVLTGERYGGQVPSSEPSNEDEDIEIQDAVNNIIKKIEQKSRSHPNDELTFGQYVDWLVGSFASEIYPRMYERRIQHPISLKKRDDLFNKLWEFFKLKDIFNNQERWDSEKADETVILRMLNKIFNEKISEQFQQSRHTFSSYTILKYYFELERNEDAINEDAIGRWSQKVDIELIKKAFVKSLMDMKIRKSIIERIKNFPEAILTLYTDTYHELTVVHHNIKENDEFPFYIAHVDKLVTEEDRRRLELSKTWNEIENAKENIRNSQFKNIPLLEIQIAE